MPHKLTCAQGCAELAGNAEIVVGNLCTQLCITKDLCLGNIS